jgi:hypothetical protein
MGDAEDDPAGHDDESPAPHTPPLTPALLADLQAGLLDDDEAARLRRRIRTDPEAEATLRALQRVRHDVAAAGDDPAPDVAPAVNARISAALRSAPPPHDGGATHSARPRVRTGGKVVAVGAGVGAAVAAAVVGALALVNAPEPTPSAPVTAEHITVSTPPMTIPLSAEQILALLDHGPDYGSLADASRRASCLTGLGYPAATRVLGAQPIAINARPGVLLVLPADTPDNLAVYAVAPNCSAADTGLLASTQIHRP